MVAHSPLNGIAWGQPSAAEQSEGKPSDEDMAEAKALYVVGKRLYDSEKYAQAADRFKEAYRLSGATGLLFNIGYSYGQMGDDRQALYYYELLLAEANPGSRGYEEAKEQAEALRAAGVEPRAPARSVGEVARVVEPAEPAEITHTAIAKAPPGLAIDITAAVPRDATWQLTLYYRSRPKGSFSRVAMAPRYSDLVGRIPAGQTETKAVYYYIEARDSKRAIVARSGTAASPHSIAMDPRARPMYYADLDGKPGFEPSSSWPPAPPRPPAPAVMRRPDRAARELGRPALSPSVEPASDDQPDRGARALAVAKWGATAGAVLFVGSFAGFSKAAADEATSLQNDAEASAGECERPPCRGFSAFQRDRQQRGERFENLARLSLGLGIASAGVAGYLWYRDLRRQTDRKARSSRPSSRAVAVPLVDSDFLGGAAVWRF